MTSPATPPATPGEIEPGPKAPSSRQPWGAFARIARGLFGAAVVGCLAAAVPTTALAELGPGGIMAGACFEANQGQAPDGTLFVSHRNGGTLSLKGSEVVFELRSREARLRPAASCAHGDAEAPSTTLEPSRDRPVQIRRLTVRLLSAQAHPQVEGAEKLSGRVNYFLGNNPAGWRTGIATYAVVRCHDVYPGVDWIHYSTRQGFEFDFLVSAGADPNQIRFQIEGADSVLTDGNGGLSIGIGGQTLLLRRPILWQRLGGREQVVSGGFVFSSRSEVSFWTGSYDRTAPLLIDPVLEYSTFVGGNGDETGNAIAVDAAGSVFVTGWTTSVGFDRGAIFAAKVNPAGTHFDYITTIGGMDLDQGLGIAVNAAGHAVIVGHTQSIDFPTTNAIQQTLSGMSDACVFELNSTGDKLVYSTYLGGGGQEVDLGFGQILTGGAGIALDTAGNAYIVGSTTSSDFPVTSNAFQKRIASTNQLTLAADVFVAKLTPGGTSLEYATLLGGTGLDQGMGIAVDSVGQVYVAGATSSPDFPTLNAFQPRPLLSATAPFLAKLNPAGSDLIYSTYLTGAGQANSVAVDSTGAIYLTGATSGGLPTTPGVFQRNVGGSAAGAISTGPQDAFALKLNSAGNEVIYSTYLGGGQADSGLSIAVSSGGEAVVVGSTRSGSDSLTPGIEFPMRNPLQPARVDRDENAFVVKLNAAGDAVYSTTFGGSLDDSARAVALSGSGIACVTGKTQSADFPLRNPIQPTMAGTEAFIAAISDAGSASPVVIEDPAAGGFRQRFYRARLLSGAQFMSLTGAAILGPGWTNSSDQPQFLGR